MQTAITESHRGLLTAIQGAANLLRDPPTCALRAADVSRWSVQEHLEHLLLADRAILAWLTKVAQGAIEGSDGGRPTVAGYVVLLTGWIPRGRGRAPDRTAPAGAPLHELQRGCESVETGADALRDALPRLAGDPRTLRHPLLGAFTAARWLRFAHIHHLHHGKIIAAIEATHSV